VVAAILHLGNVVVGRGDEPEEAAPWGEPLGIRQTRPQKRHSDQCAGSLRYASDSPSVHC